MCVYMSICIYISVVFVSRETPVSAAREPQEPHQSSRLLIIMMIILLIIMLL